MKESLETHKARTKYENKLLDLELVMRTRGKFIPKACFLDKESGTHRYVRISAANFDSKILIYYSEDRKKCFKVFSDIDWMELTP